MIDNPYRVLGLEESATDEQVKVAYKKLAKQYHPDLHGASPYAESKMKEINEAYTQIMKGERGAARQQGGPGWQQGGPGYGGPGWQEWQGFRGFTGWQQSWQQGAGNQGYGGPREGESSRMTAVRNYLQAGYYREAMNVLDTIAERGARWYYYAAVAASGLGNRTEALDHAQTAARMEPNNHEYQRLLEELQFGATHYQQFGQGFSMPSMDIGKVCMGLCAARLCCMFCGC